MPTYRVAHRRLPPKRSRRLPVYGKGDDAGRYFRCWNCGFICDSKRDSLGGADSVGGDNHQDFALQAGSNYRAGGSDRPVGTLDVMAHYQMALRIATSFSGTPLISQAEGTLSMQGETLTFGTEQLYFDESEYLTAPAPSTTSYSVYHHHKTNITAGCPFCGCTNYRGDY